MKIIEKFTKKEGKVEFDDLAFGLLCCVNRNKKFKESNIEGCYTLLGFFEWVDPAQYESLLLEWSTEFGVDLFNRKTYELGLSPFTRK
jgi:hypothetical protein